MPSTITLTVKVNKDDLNNLETRIKKINSTPIEIKATIPKDLKKFAANLAEVSRNLSHVTTNMKQTNREARSLAKENTRLAQTNKEVVKSENQVKEAEQRRITSENNLKAAAERRASAETSANARIVAAQQKTRQEQEKTQRELLKTERAVTKVSSAWQRMFSAFSVSNIISSSVTRAISRMRQYFHEALDEMKQLDTALTHYQQVTGASEAEAESIGRSSYSTASKYGTSASDYAESIATYARAGYQEASDELAELSLKTVIVGQTTQEVADQFLLTMDAAYKYGGSVEKLSKVLDGASAIDSTYATTIEKIASGLGLVAPLAAQVHVSEEELTAAIGTITAATQRSGAESARALRSLFLNIIGDTTTEIEDGVTATEESVKDMQFVLEHYAKSAVDAARATGEVVNPMEAIGALAQSMNEGLLTEAELMDLLSSLGGKLRVSQLVALVSHWDTYTKMIDTYKNSMGSADVKVTTYLDSWEAKTNILKNTWVEFIAKSADTSFFKGVLDGATNLLKAIGNIGKAVKVVLGTVLSIKTMQLGRTLNNVTARLTEISVAATNAGQSAKAASAMAQANLSAFASKALGIAGIVIGAITLITTAVRQAHDNRMQMLDEQVNRAVESAKEEQEEAKNTYDVAVKYYSAKRLYEEGTISKSEYETATRQLAEALGIEASAIEDVEKKIQSLSQKELLQAIQETRNSIPSLRARAVEEANYKNKWNKGFNRITTNYGIYKEQGMASEDALLKAYNEAVAYRDDLIYKINHGMYGDGGVLGKDGMDLLLNSINDDLKDYSEVMEPWLAQEQQIVDLEQQRRTLQKENIYNQLKDLGEGGTVDLTDRIKIDSKKLVDAGFKDAVAGEIATTFTTTFSNVKGDVAVNMTPILPNGEVMDADEFTKYGEEVAAGIRKDDKNLQIGATFTGDDAIEKAEEAAEKAHELQEDFYIDYADVDFEPLDEASLAISRIADDTDEATESFYGLTEAIKEAEGALTDYENATKTEKSDNFDKVAEGYKKAFEDIQKGMVGSNAVTAFADVLFTPEQIMRMRKRGIEVADVIMQPFWQSIFTYTDEKGELQFITDGAEAAANFAYVLHDMADAAEDGSRVITDELGNTVATFEEIDGALSVDIADFDALSKVMSQKYDISIDPDMLTFMVESLGMYSSKSQETAEGIRSIAEAADAVNENGKIDLAKLIEGELQTDKPTEDIRKLYDRVLDLHSELNNDFEIDVGAGTLDDVKEKVEGLIANRDNLTENEAETTFDANIAPFADKAKYAESLKKDVAQPSTTSFYADISAFTSKLSGARSAYEALKSYITSNPIRIITENQSRTTKSAEGQRNFRGGLSLINEKGAELIVEGDSARIAGEGQPTLTYLKQGADVYTASETKAILGNTDYSYLYDGIGAYAGGRADGIPRPTHGGGNNTTDNGNGGTADNGGYTAPANNNNNNNNTTKPTKDKNTKDEELEKLKEKVELRKAELELLQEQGASVSKQEKKQQEVIDAMKKQLEYMEKHNASKKDRVKLETEILKAEKEQKEFELDRIKGVVEFRKSELDLLEQQDASIKKQINKNRQIYDTLGKQLKYMKQIGASQEEINKVKEEQLKIQEDINKLEKDLMGNLEKAVEGKISRINDLKKKETDAIQKQIDAIKKENEEEKKATEYQEKQLAVEEAKEKLKNARAERTIRYFNAKTGQWEWKADAQAIKTAKDELDQAKKTLNEAKDDARIAKLEAKQERIEAKRDAQIESWQKVLDSFKDPVISIEKAIKTIEKNATKAQKAEIKALNKLLKPLGYQISTKNLYDSGGVLSGMGGIKATANDEVILPPDITKKMLTPMSSAILSNRLSELRYLYGMTGGNLAGITNNSSIGSQHNGDLYTFGNITLTEAQARSTTIYDLVQRSRSLRAYSAM